MGCDDYPRPERDIAYDETLKLVGQLTGAASYGRDLLKAYQQRGDELTKLRAELADERAAAVEAAKEYNASCGALIHERDALLAENADLRRLCANEHSCEGQAMDSHVKAGANPDDVCASTLCGHKRKDHLSWDGEPANCGHPDCHASANLRCQAFVEPAAPAPGPAPAESQPVQVREEAARRLRAAASTFPVELNCTGISLRRLAQWLEEQRPPVDTPACDAVARALVPAEVDNPVRIADRLRGLKAVQVLKQLVDAIEDDHAGDMTPLWTEARRVLGETK